MADERLSKLAKLLVNYSTGIKKDDIVFICADEVATSWVIEVAKEAIKLGAHVEYRLESEEVSEVKLKYANEEQLKQGNLIYETLLQKADVWLTAWGGRNTRSLSKVDPQKIKLSQQGSSKWKSIYSQRCGDGSLRWCGTQYPTYSDAQEASMSISEYEDFVYEAGLLDKDDPIKEWKRISKEQERWIKYLNTKSDLHIVSDDTDIRVGIKGRKWINCDGKENFPDGEIFTSPIENDINGYIKFSFPGIFMGKQIEGIKLEVKDGKIIKASAEKGEELLKELLETDKGSKFFGEVAIGTNYGIKEFTSNMLFDEKIGGTIHMAIGDSMPEAGGKNKSSLHWDMLCDMRSNGKIYADGEIFYENGKFLDEILEKYNL
ncbi:aminopeptidase [Romboutsia lituseburensis]|uniref:Leucyl aminopeptidase (Aminopeptidase T) n=1 Tax=Romboutsia lituseburensis DSM 797 TaxID=1121325 RepID=A0A1G9UTQ5_9FIRM|nr:aminopeptidase [Romboutsia lituseburensis]CEH35822.1 Thermophilic metalloprotease protein [Romboutsia lituseburensis]SDM62945.1 Leucyl aminopeptidase (aminopeptidase T) [Romboutsia lituseburensis DSM 797]